MGQTKDDKDPQTIKQLFDLYYVPLCNYALKMVHNRHTAEDLVQEVFVQLFERKDLSQIEAVERYLIRCVKYKCIDHLRGKKHHQLLDPNSLAAKATYQPSDLNEESIEPLLHYYVAKLPPKTREVFLLSRQQQLTYPEIAETLNISVKTVEGQMARALRMLRELLKKQGLFSFFYHFF
ncbi:MAG: RNA polymerase sigma-70 factor [Flavobacteriaceae bacterium]